MTTLTTEALRLCTYGQKFHFQIRIEKISYECRVYDSYLDESFS